MDLLPRHVSRVKEVPSDHKLSKTLLKLANFLYFCEYRFARRVAFNYALILCNADIIFSPTTYNEALSSGPKTCGCCYSWRQMGEGSAEARGSDRLDCRNRRRFEQQIKNCEILTDCNWFDSLFKTTAPCRNHLTRDSWTHKKIS